MVSATPVRNIATAKVLSKKPNLGGVANDEEEVAIHRPIVAETTTHRKALKNGTRKSAAIELDDVTSVVTGGDAPTDVNDLASAQGPQRGK